MRIKLWVEGKQLGLQSVAICSDGLAPGALPEALTVSSVSAEKDMPSAAE